MKILSCFLNLFKLLVLGLVAVALFSHKDANASTYDFFYFLQTWPGSVHPTPTGVPENFGVHGLWPQMNDGATPRDCPAPPAFDVKKVANIRQKLDKEWPSLSQRTNEEFWKYEWEKHGGCSQAILDENKYFNAGLLLKEKTKVFQTLKDKNIIPNDQLYSQRLIQKTLKDKVGFTPLIKCNTNGSDPTPEFYEVYFCVDPTGANFIDCPAQAVERFDQTARCGQDKPSIKYPIYKRHSLVLNSEESP